MSEEILLLNKVSEIGVDPSCKIPDSILDPKRTEYPIDALHPPFVIIDSDRYKVDTVGNPGGMCTVFKAHDSKLGRNVGIKVPDVTIPANLVKADATHYPELINSLTLLIKEARALARLDGNPHVAKVYDLVAAQTMRGEVVTAFVMEWIDGKTLETYFDERANIESEFMLRDRLEMLSDLADGIDYIHSKGLVHRDIKPRNILLENGTGRTVVIDVGLGQIGKEDLSAPVCTVEYSSPEVFNMDQPAPSDDVWSYSYLCLVALLNYHPFNSKYAEIIVNNVEDRVYNDVDMYTAKLRYPNVTREGLKTMLSVLFANRIEERPKSCQESLDYIKSVLGVQKVELRAPLVRLFPKQVI